MAYDSPLIANKVVTICLALFVASTLYASAGAAADLPTHSVNNKTELLFCRRDAIHSGSDYLGSYEVHCRPGRRKSLEGKECDNGLGCCSCEYGRTYQPDFNVCGDCILVTNCTAIGLRILKNATLRNDTVCGEKLDADVLWQGTTDISGISRSITSVYTANNGTEESTTIPIHNSITVTTANDLLPSIYNLISVSLPFFILLCCVAGSAVITLCIMGCYFCVKWMKTGKKTTYILTSDEEVNKVDFNYSL